ncbi:DUF6789 family protein [Falsihalocynthiibacter arcticus]|uniref:Uncharacterized protein n=1 Tax=Falsihalocynthiibacter arcticus TaxID=1579316 RepID=A0A126V3X1_9RHOB|nr:DUF6789 family protein [Falsihalocynthiibacter arcticus]AML53031.1 hypothetical protein RC74_18775 [Falsihalocynthiibacter arcticus]
MTNLKSGFLAGFIATAVLSVLMVMKGVMGVMPELDVAAMLAGMIGAPVIVGWIAHFMIGTIAWGGGFAVLYDMIPGRSAVQKGIVFGIADWLGMMIVIMPMAGAGLFGLGLGMMAPVMTLVLHIIFGAVLGAVFANRTQAELAH